MLALSGGRSGTAPQVYTDAPGPGCLVAGTPHHHASGSSQYRAGGEARETCTNVSMQMRVADQLAGGQTCPNCVPEMPQVLEHSIQLQSVTLQSTGGTGQASMLHLRTVNSKVSDTKSPFLPTHSLLENAIIPTCTTTVLRRRLHLLAMSGEVSDESDSGTVEATTDLAHA